VILPSSVVILSLASDTCIYDREIKDPSDSSSDQELSMLPTSHNFHFPKQKRPYSGYLRPRVVNHSKGSFLNVSGSTLNGLRNRSK